MSADDRPALTAGQWRGLRNPAIRYQESADMRVEQVQVVKAPREQVFEAWTDYEAWPRFSGLFSRVSVKERTGNTVHIDAEVKLMGRRTTRSEMHLLTPPEQVRVEGETETATNTTLWTFEPVPEGTRVTAVVDAELGGLTKLLGPLAKRQVQAMLREWMQGLARYVEAK
jgi:carbon monoxide dehydrogenase subunit G